MNNLKTIVTHLENSLSDLQTLQAAYQALITKFKSVESTETDLLDKLVESLAENRTTIKLKVQETTDEFVRALTQVLEAIKETREMGAEIEKHPIEEKRYRKIPLESVLDQIALFHDAVDQIEIARNRYDQHINLMKTIREDLIEVFNYVAKLEIPFQSLLELIKNEINNIWGKLERAPHESAIRMLQLQSFCYGLVYFYQQDEFGKSIRELTLQLETSYLLGGGDLIDLETCARDWQHNAVDKQTTTEMTLGAIYDNLVQIWFKDRKRARQVRANTALKDWEEAITVPVWHVSRYSDRSIVDAVRICVNEQVKLLGMLETKRKDCAEQNLRLRKNLIAQLESLEARGEELFKTLHHSQPEFQALERLLTEAKEPTDSSLMNLVAQLNELLERLDLIVPDMLNRYWERMDENYLFEESQEIHQLGMALLSVSTIAEYYESVLWQIGEDFLLRSELSGFDTMEFYLQYGLKIIENSLRAAIEHDRLPYVLAFLNKFLPPIKPAGYETYTQYVLEHSPIRNLLLNAFESNKGKLNISATDFDKIDVSGVLRFLEHADYFDMPTNHRLQWAASLLAIIGNDKNSKHAYQAVYLYLRELQIASLNLAFYYTLLYYGDQFPELWDEKIFIAGMLHVMREILDATDVSRQTIIEFCLNEQIRHLFSQHKDAKFTLSMLTHYGGFELGNRELKNYAWWYWDEIMHSYPEIAAFAKSQIEGELIVYETKTELEVRYQYLLNESIEKQLTSPPYSGKRIAVRIHMWYVENYMRRWLSFLHRKDISESDLEQIKLEIYKIINYEDYVDECPEQKNPPPPHRALWSPSPLKNSVNDNLFDLLNSFQKAVQVRQTIFQHDHAKRFDLKKLRDEVVRLREDSEMSDWACTNIVARFVPKKVLTERSTKHR